ncbi:hypothetical protein [Reyranella sp. CPCC 100927]|uniref:hypothetical protein n=1 Tax=Reyranella sp. CPCC 100927 TaxID=2599616 RepID=UPI0011B3FD61|nr:hypothetical protein [Reyranella sp. CPCC 100927]TWT05097.1 hypothetical protein FQU96_25970 [Reyranella sp. CPCC 100927]
MRRYLAAILGLTAFLTTGVAGAEVIQRYNTGSWTVEANAENGSLQNCTASGQYGGGASVIFMLTRSLTWGIAINNPNWNWRTGSEGGISYWVDSFGRRNGTARALGPTRLLVLLADSQQLFHEIRQGNRMYFEPKGANGFSITLVGTSVALNELLACVQRHR